MLIRVNSWLRFLCALCVFAVLSSLFAVLFSPCSPCSFWFIPALSLVLASLRRAQDRPWRLGGSFLQAPSPQPLASSLKPQESRAPRERQPPQKSLYSPRSLKIEKQFRFPFPVFAPLAPWRLFLKTPLGSSPPSVRVTLLIGFSYPFEGLLRGYRGAFEGLPWGVSGAIVIPKSLP